MGPLLAYNICNNLCHFSWVKIDEDYLKCMPVFNCPKCFKECFFTFPSHAFKEYIENRELNLTNVQEEFCKENTAQLQSIRCQQIFV